MNSLRKSLNLYSSESLDCSDSDDQNQAGIEKRECIQNKEKNSLKGDLDLEFNTLINTKFKRYWVEIDEKNCRIYRNRKCHITKFIIPTDIMLQVDWIPQQDTYSKFRLRTKARDFIFQTPDSGTSTSWCTYFSKFIPQDQKFKLIAKPIFECPVKFQKKKSKKWIVITQELVHILDKKQDWEFQLKNFEMNIKDLEIETSGDCKIFLKFKKYKLVLNFDKSLDRDTFFHRANYIKAEETDDSKMNEDVKSLIYADPSNRYCADCDDGPDKEFDSQELVNDLTNLPDWFAPHFGIVVCSKCAGFHRNIKRLDSIALDFRVWQRKERLIYVKYFTNSQTNKFWEAIKPKKISKSTSDKERGEFITEKYTKKTFTGDEFKGKNPNDLLNKLASSITQLDFFKAFKILNFGVSTLEPVPNYNNKNIVEMAGELDSTQQVVIAIKELISIFTITPKASIKGFNEWHSDKYLDNRKKEFKSLKEIYHLLHSSTGRIFNSQIDSQNTLLETPFHTIEIEDNYLILRGSDEKGKIIDHKQFQMMVQFPTIPQVDLQSDWLKFLNPKGKNSGDNFYTRNLFNCSLRPKSGCIIFSMCLKFSFGSEDYKLKKGDDFQEIILDMRCRGPDEQMNLYMRKLSELFCSNFVYESTQIDPLNNFTSIGWVIMKEYLTGLWTPKWLVLIDRILYTFPLEDSENAQNIQWNQEDLVKQNFSQDNLNSVNIYDLRMMINVEIRSQYSNDEHTEGPNIKSCGYNIHPDTCIVLSMQNITLYICAEGEYAQLAWFRLFKDIFDYVGNSLEEQVLTTSYVPFGLDKAIKYIDVNAVSCCDGLYRQSGVLRHVDACYRNIVFDPRNFPNTKLYEISPHVVCGAIKKFFINLTESIFTKRIDNEFLRSFASVNTEGKKVSFVKSSIRSLPMINYSTLRRLCIHLNAVARNHKVTLMTIDNLSLIFGSCLFKAESGLELQQNLSQSSSFVKFLLENFLEIFDISQEEHEREKILQAHAAKMIEDARKPCNEQPDQNSSLREKSNLLKSPSSNIVLVPVLLKNLKTGNRFERVIIKPETRVITLINELRLTNYKDEKNKRIIISESISQNMMKRDLGQNTNLYLLVNSWTNLDIEAKKSSHLVIHIEDYSEKLISDEFYDYSSENFIDGRFRTRVEIFEQIKINDTNKSLMLHAQKIFSSKSQKKLESSKSNSESAEINVDTNTGLLTISYFLTINKSFTWPLSSIGVYDGIGASFANNFSEQFRKKRLLSSSFPSLSDNILSDEDKNLISDYEPAPGYVTLIPPNPERISSISTTSNGYIDLSRSMINSMNYSDIISGNGTLGPALKFFKEEELTFFKILLKSFWVKRQVNTVSINEGASILEKDTKHINNANPAVPPPTRPRTRTHV